MPDTAVARVRRTATCAAHRNVDPATSVAALAGIIRRLLVRDRLVMVPVAPDAALEADGSGCLAAASAAAVGR